MAIYGRKVKLILSVLNFIWVRIELFTFAINSYPISIFSKGKKEQTQY